MGKNPTKIECICEYCHKSFSANLSQVKRGGGRFCNRACSAANRSKSIVKQCEHCGKSFSVNSSRVNMGWGRFCCLKCANLAQTDRIEYQCEYCGKTFTRKKGKAITKRKPYCNLQCRKKATKYVERTCLCCGSTFTVPERSLKHYGCNFCSRACLYKWNVGENHVDWRGGQKKKRGLNWSTQRRLAYNRDGGVCQLCHRKRRNGEREFDVHHIKPFRTFKGDYLSANDLSNLITLCPHCHHKAERGLTFVPKHLI